MVDDLSTRFGWNTDFGIASDSMKTYYSKRMLSSIFLNGQKSELRWLSRFQDIEGKGHNGL